MRLALDPPRPGHVTSQNANPTVPIRPIVAFDFDGTLTVSDTFLPFIRHGRSPGRLAAGVARLVPALFAYGIKRDRGRFKAAVVREFLAGLTIAEVSGQAETFAAENFEWVIRPDAVRAWDEWKSRDAQCLIVTASPELIVAPFARRLEADLLIGTRLEVVSGRLTGRLDGPNCRGAQKVIRLQEALGERIELAAAYGDSAGDHEMLAMAGLKGMKVFRGKPNG